MTSIAPQRLQQLRAVFGAEVPKDAGLALGVLDHSPAAPTSTADLAALREAALSLAGQRLDAAGAAAAHVAPATSASSTAARPMPATMALRLAEAARAKGGAGALARSVPLDVAQRLVAEAAADIPWHFVADGCFFRAHTVAKRLEDAGVFSEKAWAITAGAELIIDGDKSRNGFSVVVNHVATSLHVQLPDGTRQRMVVDPSVSDALLTVDQWTAQLRSARGGAVDVLYMPRFMMMLWEREKPPATWQQRDLDDAQQWHAGGWREAEKAYEDIGYFDDPMKHVVGA